jgi:two-component system response regulator HydG
MSKILIVDDDLDICELLCKFLSRKGYEAASTHNAADALAELKKNQYDLIISDFRLPDDNGLNLLQRVKILQPDAQFILITGYSDVKMAVKAMKLGAYEYVTKPLHPDEILSTIKSALEDTDKKKVSSAVVADTGTTDYIDGKSAAAVNILKHMELVGPTDMTVIIQGETGSGKEYIASTIHQKSKRAQKPFMAVDCGALTNELAGSELFGHEKGAFTGAVSAKPGSFELANGGTLFLDEIGNLSYEIQVKLLRVLQERKITRIGGTKDKPVDVRIVVATNEDLREKVREGEFREDLFHRLNEFSIYMPPLRERKEDIMLFAAFFLKKANSSLSKNIKSFDPAVVDIFENYPWYGNLREMRNVIKRAVLLTQSDKIDKTCLPHEIAYHTHQQFKLSESDLDSTSTDLKSMAEQAEKKAILNALKQTDNNKTQAAKVLKIDRKTLYNKLKEYDIDL